MLIVALVVADVLALSLFSFLTVFPPGWLYPVIFYIQMVPILTAFFPETFEPITPYLSYVSSATSFYFIYDFCLGKSFPAVGAYFVRFIPLLISVVVSVTVLAIRYRRKLKHRKWAGLWWLVLLQYTHVVHTSVSVLNCPLVPGPDGNIDYRWYVSGDVICFRDAHLGLTVLSVLVLAFAALIVLMFIIYAVWQPKHGLMKGLSFPMGSAFKYRCWGGLDILRRVVLLLLIAVFPGIDFALMLVLMVITTVWLFVQPYKSFNAVVMEAVLSVIVLSMFLSKNAGEDLFVWGMRFLVYSPPPSAGTSADCQDTVHALSVRSCFLGLLYYAPLIALLVGLIICVVKLIQNRFRLQQDIVNETTSARNEYYQRNYDSATIEVSSNHIPFSVALARIFDRRPTPEREEPANKSNTLGVETRHRTKPLPLRVVSDITQYTVTKDRPPQAYEPSSESRMSNFEIVELAELAEFAPQSSLSVEGSSEMVEID